VGIILKPKDQLIPESQSAISCIPICLSSVPKFIVHCRAHDIITFHCHPPVHCQPPASLETS